MQTEHRLLGHDVKLHPTYSLSCWRAFATLHRLNTSSRRLVTGVSDCWLLLQLLKSLCDRNRLHRLNTSSRWLVTVVSYTKVRNWYTDIAIISDIGDMRQWINPIWYHFWVKTYRIQYIAIYWLDLVALKIIKNRCFLFDFEGTDLIFLWIFDLHGGYFDTIVPPTS